MMIIGFLKIGTDFLLHNYFVRKLAAHYLFAVLTTIPAIVLGYLKAPQFGYVFREFIGIGFLGFVLFSQYLTSPKELALTLKLAAHVPIIMLFIRIFLVISDIDSKALGIYYGDSAAIFSSFSILYLILKSKFNLENKMIKNISSVIILLFFTVTLFSTGRIATLAVTYAILRMLKYSEEFIHQKKRYIGKYYNYGFFVLAILILSIEFQVLPKELTRRYEELSNGIIAQKQVSIERKIEFEGSSGWRIKGYLDAWDNFIRKPVFGIGWGTPLKTNKLGSWVWYDKGGYVRPLTIHNTILAILLASGIIGLGGMLRYLFFIFKHGDTPTQEVSIINSFFHIALQSFIIVSMAQPVFVAYNAAWIWCFLGLYYAIKKYNNNQKKEVLKYLFGYNNNL